MRHVTRSRPARRARRRADPARRRWTGAATRRRRLGRRPGVRRGVVRPARRRARPRLASSPPARRPGHPVAGGPRLRRRGLRSRHRRCRLAGTRGDHRASCVVLAAVALVLDAVDGRVARRTGTVHPLGARFDMETDAFLILVLSAARRAGPRLVGAGHRGWPATLLLLVALAARWAPWLRGQVPGDCGGARSSRPTRASCSRSPPRGLLPAAVAALAVGDRAGTARRLVRHRGRDAAAAVAAPADGGRDPRCLPRRRAERRRRARAAVTAPTTRTTPATSTAHQRARRRDERPATP